MKLERRWDNGKGYKSNSRFWEDIERYGWSAFDHIIIEQNLSKDQAMAMEKELIAKYLSTDEMVGYNVSYGGEKFFEGMHHTEQAKQAISRKLKDQEFTEEHKKHLSESKSGSKHHFAKKVYQYTKTGELVKVWDYMTQAAEELGIRKGNISLACLGKRPSAGGFLWSY